VFAFAFDLILTVSAAVRLSADHANARRIPSEALPLPIILAIFQTKGDTENVRTICFVPGSVSVSLGLVLVRLPALLFLLVVMSKSPIVSSLVINNVELIEVLGQDIISVTFVDVMYGSPSQIKISFDDTGTASDLIKQNTLVSIKFKYRNESEEINTSTHTIDTIERQEIPSIVTFGGIGYHWLSGLSSTEPIWRRDTKLNQLVNEIVNTYGLQFSGNPSSDVTVGTRSDPSDPYVEIRFNRPINALYTLGQQFGYSCQIWGSYLRFWSFAELNQLPTQGFLTLSDIGNVIQSVSSSFKRYSQVHVKYGGTVDNPLWAASGNPDGGVEYLDREGFYRDNASATFRSVGERYRLNNDADTLKLMTTGAPWQYAERNITITGFLYTSQNNGKYRIYKAIHMLSGNGWDCELELQKIE